MPMWPSLMEDAVTPVSVAPPPPGWGTTPPGLGGAGTVPPGLVPAAGAGALPAPWAGAAAPPAADPDWAALLDWAELPEPGSAGFELVAPVPLLFALPWAFSAPEAPCCCPARCRAACWAVDAPPQAAIRRTMAGAASSGRDRITSSPPCSAYRSPSCARGGAVSSVGATDCPTYPNR